MTEIEFETIESEYKRVLSNVLSKYPLNAWVIKPVGVGLTRHKTKYGFATKHGTVEINEGFIGTSAYRKLDFTLRHELAHLAVGLDQHRNKKFRVMEMAFGADRTLDLSGDYEQIVNNIGYKYSVIAHLEDGNKYEVGGVHKKTKKYTEYPRNGVLNMKVNGVRIFRFEFMDLKR